MGKKYVLSLDQGTTSSRAIIFDRSGSIVSSAQKEFRQLFPRSGWVEHDADEIWSTQLRVAVDVLAKANIDADEIASIGITNQRETTVVWDRGTGRPIYNAIVWQDRRTADFCNDLKSSGKGGLIQEKTGLIPDAYFSATKVAWILDNVAGAREKANRGELCFGTIDSWLLWNLTDGRVHATDVSNASRTMLCNIHTLQWDGELQEIFDIPGNMLPDIRSSSEVYGFAENILSDSRIPIAGIAGDQQAALFGQMCVDDGMVKNTYGTGCFMLMNTGEKPVKSKSGLLTTVAWKVDGKTNYALEGSVFIGGAVVQWLRDSLRLINTSAEVESLSRLVNDSDGVFFVPAFAGLGTPHWIQEARGSIFGLTRGSTDAHIARAALESIAFQTMDVLQAMEKESGIPIAELRADGGATVNDDLMQFQADILDARVICPSTTETTALGAAYLAGLAVKFWDNFDEIRSQWRIDRQFLPGMEDAQRRILQSGWQRAVNAAKTWAEGNS